jgi:hypothetical protein
MQHMPYLRTIKAHLRTYGRPTDKRQKKRTKPSPTSRSPLNLSPEKKFPRPNGFSRRARLSHEILPTLIQRHLGGAQGPPDGTRMAMTTGNSAPTRSTRDKRKQQGKSESAHVITITRQYPAAKTRVATATAGCRRVWRLVNRLATPWPIVLDNGQWQKTTTTTSAPAWQLAAHGSGREGEGGGWALGRAGRAGPGLRPAPTSSSPGGFGFKNNSANRQPPTARGREQRHPVWRVAVARYAHRPAHRPAYRPACWLAKLRARRLDASTQLIYGIPAPYCTPVASLPADPHSSPFGWYFHTQKRPRPSARPSIPDL